MKYLVQKIKIIITYQKGLTNKERTMLDEAITSRIPTYEDLTVEIQNNQSLVISANILKDAVEVFESCKTISDENNLDFVVIMKVENSVTLDESVESDNFVGRYMKMPRNSADIAGLGLRFIYNASTNPILVVIEGISKHEIQISANDLLDKTYEFKKSYEYLNASINEIFSFGNRDTDDE